MSLESEYRDARRDEATARLRRILVLRAMAAAGMSQREIAATLGISQPAVSQQLKSAPALDGVHPRELLAAATPVIKALAAERGYARLAVFGSVARGVATEKSDIDLLVQAPEGTSSLEFVGFRQLLVDVLGREIDLVDYGGIRPGIDDDVTREAVPL